MANVYLVSFSWLGTWFTVWLQPHWFTLQQSTRLNKARGQILHSFILLVLHASYAEYAEFFPRLSATTVSLSLPLPMLMSATFAARVEREKNAPCALPPLSLSLSLFVYEADVHCDKSFSPLLACSSSSSLPWNGGKKMYEWHSLVPITNKTRESRVYQ